MLFPFSGLTYENTGSLGCWDILHLGHSTPYSVLGGNQVNRGFWMDEFLWLCDFSSVKVFLKVVTRENLVVV